MPARLGACRWSRRASGQLASLANTPCRLREQINWRTLLSALFIEIRKGQQMAWKAPKIVEVSVGMEINMYMCATRT